MSRPKECCRSVTASASLTRRTGRISRLAVGAAYDVFGTGKTVLRAGFGMIYVQPSIRTFAFSGGGLNLNPSSLIPGGKGTMNSFLISPGNNNDTDCSVGPCADWSTNPTQGSIFPINDPTLASCSADNPCNFFGVDQKLKTPFVVNWNVNVQQEIAVRHAAADGVRREPGTMALQHPRPQPAEPGSLVSMRCWPRRRYENADITGCEIAARPLTNCTVGSGSLLSVHRIPEFPGEQVDVRL